jgi:hypothetical protein
MHNILNKYTHAFKKDPSKTFKTKTYDLSDYEEIKTNLMKYAMIEEKDMNREISFTPDEDVSTLEFNYHSIVLIIILISRIRPRGVYLQLFYTELNLCD